MNVRRTNFMSMLGSSFSSVRPNKANKLSSDFFAASLSEEAQNRYVREPTINLLCESERNK